MASVCGAASNSKKENATFVFFHCLQQLDHLFDQFGRDLVELAQLASTRQLAQNAPDAGALEVGEGLLEFWGENRHCKLPVCRVLHRTPSETLGGNPLHVSYDVLYGTMTPRQCGEAEGSTQDTWIHVHGGHAANAVWCPRRDSVKQRGFVRTPSRESHGLGP